MLYAQTPLPRGNSIYSSQQEKQWSTGIMAYILDLLESYRVSIEECLGGILQGQLSIVAAGFCGSEPLAWHGKRASVILSKEQRHRGKGRRLTG